MKRKSLFLILGGRQFSLIDRTVGTNIGNMVDAGGLAAAFDGNTNQATAVGARVSVTTDGWVGKTLAAPAKFGKAIAYGSNDQGFDASATSVTLRIYGKQGTAPANGTDGTLIGTLDIIDQDNESGGRTIPSLDINTPWDHLWLDVHAGSSPKRVAELLLYSVP